MYLIGWLYGLQSMANCWHYNRHSISLKQETKYIALINFIIKENRIPDNLPVGTFVRLFPPCFFISLTNFLFQVLFFCLRDPDIFISPWQLLWHKHIFLFHSGTIYPQPHSSCLLLSFYIFPLLWVEVTYYSGYFFSELQPSSILWLPNF